ncbi:hypothetical protein DFP72DRAFT_482644 [Ephemerocybe angulata]|uniref:Uncharacterized protein n=1 Tax=Ephemerocybe angulata TaxID=980116 RepID=A0A8H6IEW4_9AGAR|nr:hypothetical protein DFP72DRAFT_482644 [Tulosesus angulatus]
MLWLRGILQGCTKWQVHLKLLFISLILIATKVKGWEDVAADALSDMCSVKVPLEETDLTQPHARLLRSLIVSLSQPQHALRIHAIKMLKHVSSPSPNLFNGIIDASIKSIASMTVYDDQDVRDDGFELLSELAKADGKKPSFLVFNQAWRSMKISLGFAP